MNNPAVDYEPNAVFAAVGQATTSWETLEAQLSYVYSIFVGTPMLIEALEAYGRDARIFESRMQSLCRAAEAYFLKNPSQENEAEISDIIREARRLSGYRHQIAHGVVTPIYEPAALEGPLAIDDEIPLGRFQFILVPPWHGVFHLAKRTGYYHYGAAEILQHGRDFRALSMRAEKFAERLHPKQSC